MDDFKWPAIMLVGVAFALTISQFAPKETKGEPMPTAQREELKEGRDHLTKSGTFQSDKYEWCPAGFVPLKLTDPAAREVLKTYAEKRGDIDAEFKRDLLEAIQKHEK